MSKSTQIGALQAAAQQLEKRHQWEVAQARRTRPGSLPEVDSNAMWERTYAARFKALTDAMARILETWDGDQAAFDKAMEAQHGTD